ncbi:MAG: DNA repair protein RecO [Lachnospiraceae bacterium]|nr:DNA repair protein RecO [Lachnospiraceae bacterium]MBR5944559.1 DNA repair protein RecO [Lachnospiraceae bacterium]
MVDFVSVTGIILKAEPIGEYDRRVVILTRERGKISAFARGARRQTSSMLAATAPFCFGTFKIYEGKNSYTLSEAKIDNYFPEFRTAVEEAFYGMYFLEVADYYTRENNDEAEMLKLVYASLVALLKGKWDKSFVRCVFELKAIAVNGEYPGAPEGNFNQSTLYALDFIGKTPVENLYTFTVTDEVLSEMIKVSKKYCKRYMDRTFKSVALLDDVRYNI